MGIQTISARSSGYRSALYAMSARHRIRWWALLPALLLTTAVPLTIHAEMINAGIPHPQQLPSMGLIAWADDLLTTVGLIFLLQMMSSDPRRRPSPAHVVAAIVLVAGMRGRVLRDPFMDIINTAAPIISLSSLANIFDNAVRNIPLALVTLACAALPPARYSTRFLFQVAARALLISGTTWLVVGLLVDPALHPLIGWLDTKEGSGIEQPPYDARVLVPAYATYLENASTAIIMVALIWDRLPKLVLRRIGVATALVLMLIGPAVRPFVDAINHPGNWIAIMSSGQFTMETIALGALAGLTCVASLRALPPSAEIAGCSR